MRILRSFYIHIYRHLSILFSKRISQFSFANILDANFKVSIATYSSLRNSVFLRPFHSSLVVPRYYLFHTKRRLILLIIVCICNVRFCCVKRTFLVEAIGFAYMLLVLQVIYEKYMYSFPVMTRKKSNIFMRHKIK